MAIARLNGYKIVITRFLIESGYNYSVLNYLSRVLHRGEGSLTRVLKDSFISIVIES